MLLYQLGIETLSRATPKYLEKSGSQRPTQSKPLPEPGLEPPSVRALVTGQSFLSDAGNNFLQHFLLHHLSAAWASGKDGHYISVFDKQADTRGEKEGE